MSYRFDDFSKALHAVSVGDLHPDELPRAIKYFCKSTEAQQAYLQHFPFDLQYEIVSVSVFDDFFPKFVALGIESFNDVTLLRRIFLNPTNMLYLLYLLKKPGSTRHASWDE